MRASLGTPTARGSPVRATAAQQLQPKLIVKSSTGTTCMAQNFRVVGEGHEEFFQESSTHFDGRGLTPRVLPTHHRITPSVFAYT